MASSLFEAEDQTDEDFFDTLVKDDDEIDFTVSTVENKLSNLSISEFEPSRAVDSTGEDFGISPDLGLKGEGGDLPAQESENETKKKGEFAVEEEKSEVSELQDKVKIVQWDSFNSHSNRGGNGTGFGSYSDLFGATEDNSEDPFANVGEGEGDKSWAESSLKNDVGGALGSSGLEQNNGDQNNGNSQVQNWEYLYPGWKFNPNTGQWYQVESYDVNASKNGDLSSSVNVQESLNLNSSQQFVSEWNQVSQGNTQYPAHMVFDQQYPGWYYNTILQEWKVLESYGQAVDYTQGFNQNHVYLTKNEDNYGSRDVVNQEGIANVNAWQTQQATQSVNIGYTGSQQLGNHYELKDYGNSFANQQTGFGTVSFYENSSQGFDGSFGNVEFQNVDNVGNFALIDNQANEEKYQERHFSPAQFNGQKAVLFAQQSCQSGASFSHSISEERTSERRPPHALVTFGFGGKLIVMKDANSVQGNSAYGSQQDSQGAVISILNMMEVFVDKADTSGFETGGRDYFHALCEQSFAGPLVGGNAGSKELNKWVDEKIASYETPYMDFRKAELLRLLFSLLKIALQHYGKLRSPFGTDQVLKENDSPESAVAKLFASAKRNQEYGAFAYCLHNIPSEAQIQATALEVQKLLVSGRKKEALECAQEGQLWGPALVLASQLGDQFYGDTVKKMAVKQLIAGSPLRTLCLLIAGQPADVFSNDSKSSLPSSPNILQQPAQVKANCTLDEWTDNLAIVTANRTKDDELVIIHLGDCLWKDTGEITAAHICYLVAEANFEAYADSARMCLIGADHWKFPRTYASPEAIQRTELYEYSKVLGNSQFLLLPFQPYKLIYAHMLAEVGKISDALKYCQAILKSLKTGRATEVEMWRQLASSLEERIKTHQQGGYGTNLARKLRTFFDNTATRVVGGLPPPVPSTAQGGAQPVELAQQLGGPRVAYSQSTMAMSSLMPSASMEPISEWTGESDNKTKHNRSISEPDFSRSPRKVDSFKDAKSSNTREKPSASSGSRFGRFGSQLFEKTVGLVIRSRPDRQAKLGEPNSFYYDEKLKRWVEKGAEPPAEETALPPPPTTAAFQGGIQDYGLKDSPKPERFDTISGPDIMSPNSSEKSPGMPPIPPGSNQFSARGRMGVRSRYVDTFNKSGGTAANLFHSPSTSAAKLLGGSNPKFFIPASVTSLEETVQTATDSFEEVTMNKSDSLTLLKEDSPSSMTQTSASMMAMPRFPSVDTIVSKPGQTVNENSSLPPHSRRTASWSGSFIDARSPPKMKEIKPLGEALGISPSLDAPNNPPSQLRRNSGSFGDDLHEVQL